MKTVITILISMVMLFPVEKQEEGIKLTVQVDGLKNKNGYVAIGLFDRYSDFPDGDALFSKYVEADGGSVEVTFEGLEEGEYALAILHDENGNEEMDYNEYGMPQEGFAFTGSGMANDGPPSFADASFSLSRDTVKTVDMIYMSY